MKKYRILDYKALNVHYASQFGFRQIQPSLQKHYNLHESPLRAELKFSFVQTPYELRYKEEPSLDHLRIFGSLTFYKESTSLIKKLDSLQYQLTDVQNALVESPNSKKQKTKQTQLRQQSTSTQRKIDDIDATIVSDGSILDLAAAIYIYNDYVIWGITAKILLNFLSYLKQRNYHN